VRGLKYGGRRIGYGPGTHIEGGPYRSSDSVRGMRQVLTCFRLLLDLEDHPHRMSSRGLGPRLGGAAG